MLSFTAEQSRYLMRLCDRSNCYASDYIIKHNSYFQHRQSIDESSVCDLIPGEVQDGEVLNIVEISWRDRPNDVPREVEFIQLAY